MAVTGTNGKTSTAWWWAQASALLGERCAVVGTLGIGEPPTTVGPSGSAAAAVAAITTWTATGLTTPDPATLQGGLAAFVRQGVRRCAIEASSIGLVEHRLDALNIRQAGEIEAYNYKAEAAGLRAKGKGAMMEGVGSALGSFMSAGGSLIGGAKAKSASRVNDPWYGLRRKTV